LDQTADYGTAPSDRDREKIVQQRQTIEQRHREGADTSQSARLIAVLERSLARAKSHVAFIEHRIAVEESNRKASAALIDSQREGLKPKAETLCGSVHESPAPGLDPGDTPTIASREI
jgi:hypothetical protein